MKSYDMLSTLPTLSLSNEGPLESDFFFCLDGGFGKYFVVRKSEEAKCHCGELVLYV